MSQKICFVFFLSLILFSAKSHAQSQIAGFVGTWVLDREKISMTKDFPQKLKNYTMIVAESDNLLNVKSRVTGEVVIESRNESNASTRNKLSHGGTAAIFLTPNEITYNLNGEETKVELKHGGKFTGTARVKAKPEKNGKGIQFIIIRRMRTGKGEIDVISREVWKLSDDGKSLKMQRTVELPESRDEISLTLIKSAE